MKISIQFLAIIYSLLILSSASAQNEWTSVGPSDIVIHDFISYESSLFASTNGNHGGVYQTDDFGNDWTELYELLPSDNTPFVSLASRDGEIYAAAQFRGMYVRREFLGYWVNIPVESDLQSIHSILFVEEPWNRAFLGGSRLKGTAGVSMAEDLDEWISINDGLPLSGTVHSLIATILLCMLQPMLVFIG